MKKAISALLVLVLLFSSCSGCAEGFFGSFGSFFSDALSDATDWVTGAWGDAASWIGGAWGDASKWVDRAWNDSSAWISDIWGDVSTWTSDASEKVNIWWADTFDKVTDNTEHAWNWLKNSLSDFEVRNHELLIEIKDSVKSVGTAAEEKIHAAFIDILVEFNISEEDIGKVWDSMKAYAKEKGITVEYAAKIMLPYLLQLKEGFEDAGNAEIPAVAIAQYLTGIFEKLCIETDEIAKQYVERLEEILDDM